MARRYWLEELPAAGRHHLHKATAHHLARVMRARQGDTVVLFDGRGRECDAEMVTVRGSAVEADIGPSRAVHREPAVRLQLAFALPQGPRAEWLFEHATELGVARFSPLLTARSGGAPGAGRRERWQRIVTAAAGQCDRSLLPVVDAPCTLTELLARDDLPARRWVARAGGAAMTAGDEPGCVLLIGPPGGLSDDELAQLDAGGFAAADLGPLTLRTETAALAGAALLLCP